MTHLARRSRLALLAALVAAWLVACSTDSDSQPGASDGAGGSSAGAGGSTAGDSSVLDASGRPDGGESADSGRVDGAGGAGGSGPRDGSTGTGDSARTDASTDVPDASGIDRGGDTNMDGLSGMGRSVG